MLNDQVYEVDKGARIYDTARIVKANHIIRIADKCMVCDQAFIGARVFTMDYGSQVGIGAIIGGGGKVYLGKYSVVGSNAILIPATESSHAQLMCEAAPENMRKVIRGSIEVHDGAYIGVGAILCITEKRPHLHIGYRSIVGAGAYIDRDVPDDTVVIPKQELISKPREYLVNPDSFKPEQV